MIQLRTLQSAMSLYEHSEQSIGGMIVEFFRAERTGYATRRRQAAGAGLGNVRQKKRLISSDLARLPQISLPT